MIYLASPYSDTDPSIRWARYEGARRYAARMLRAGIPTYCPVAATHPIAFYEGLPIEWEFWASTDLAILSAATGVWVLMLDGWNESTGIKIEVAEARKRGLMVWYVDPHDAPETVGKPGRKRPTT